MATPAEKRLTTADRIRAIYVQHRDEGTPPETLAVEHGFPIRTVKAIIAGHPPYQNIIAKVAPADAKVQSPNLPPGYWLSPANAEKNPLFAKVDLDALREKRSQNIGRFGKEPKLDEVDVLNILHRVKGKGETIKAVAADYPEVTTGAVWQIVKGRTWKHVYVAAYGKEPDLQNLRVPTKDNKRLADTQIFEILEAIENGESNTVIAKRYGKAAPVISRIRPKRTYLDVIARYEAKMGRPFSPVFANNHGGLRPHALTDEQARVILTRFADGETQASLAKEYGVSHGTINNICTGKHYTEVHADFLEEQEIQRQRSKPAEKKPALSVVELETRNPRTPAPSVSGKPPEVETPSEAPKTLMTPVLADAIQNLRDKRVALEEEIEVVTARLEDLQDEHNKLSNGIEALENL